MRLTNDPIRLAIQEIQRQYRAGAINNQQRHDRIRALLPLNRKA